VVNYENFNEMYDRFSRNIVSVVILCQ